MKIAIASDHRGYHLKERVITLLRAKGHTVVDDGPPSEESVDYPDFAALVAKKVSSGAVDRGILICGTGIGMSIAANKFPGVRAARLRRRSHGRAQPSAQRSQRALLIGRFAQLAQRPSAWWKSGWTPNSRVAVTSGG